LPTSSLPRFELESPESFFAIQRFLRRLARKLARFVTACSIVQDKIG
jgi:hypothetical protein